MDRLEVKLSDGDDPEVLVKFQRFRTQSEEKIPLA
jgi:menaquinol-cytochrome c reductase iron-sulfur subunit